MQQPKDSHSGFTLFVATLALMVAFVALMAALLKMNNGSQADTLKQPTSTTETAAGGTKEVSLSIKSDEEHAKKGPEGTWHDAYLPAGFTVEAGSTVRVTVHNYDVAQHTFTAPGIGVEQIIAAGSETAPSTTTFTFKAPSKPGQYDWHCMMPCDPWAMSHVGYMKGVVTVA